MAVKVRCPKCEKVLNAPDAARGKAVKCPACDTRVKIPAGESSVENDDSEGGKTPVRRAVKKVPAKRQLADGDSTEFLARLDLSKVADTSEQMCPKCGADIPDDTTECPKCGVDIATGQVTAAARKRMSRKGPDPALYYKAAWSDSWAFTKANAKVAIRTAMYFLALGGAAAGCAFMVIWCKTMPPRVFWGVFGVAFALAPPGWVWRLTVETIRVTVARKSDISEVHFDIFQNIALGVKTYLWAALFCWLPGAFFMYPLAMIHMAMPVTKRGWLNFLMLSTFFRNFLPTMYFWVVNFVTSLIVNVFFGVVAAIVLGTGLAASMQSGAGAMGSVAKWSLLSLSAVLGVVGIFIFSFVLLFNMRVIGLLAYYFKDTLDLVTLVGEKTYVRKDVKLDAFGVPIKSTGQKVGGVLFVVGLLLVVAVVAYFVYRQLSKS